MVLPTFDPTGPYAVEFEDLEYGGPPAHRLCARLYRPVGVHAPLPALVDVHGGAWMHFDRTVDAYFDRALAACGMVVAALDFRQAPIRYPTAVADVVAGQRAGGEAELAVFPGVGHAVANFPSAEADACIMRMKTFVARQLAVDGSTRGRAGSTG